jgi:hypothetical protein
MQRMWWCVWSTLRTLWILWMVLKISLMLLACRYTRLGVGNYSVLTLQTLINTFGELVREGEHAERIGMPVVGGCFC